MIGEGGVVPFFLILLFSIVKCGILALFAQGDGLNYSDKETYELVSFMPAPFSDYEQVKANNGIFLNTISRFQSDFYQLSSADDFQDAFFNKGAIFSEDIYGPWEILKQASGQSVSNPFVEATVAPTTPTQMLGAYIHLDTSVPSVVLSADPVGTLVHRIRMNADVPELIFEYPVVGQTEVKSLSINGQTSRFKSRDGLTFESPFLKIVQTVSNQTPEMELSVNYNGLFGHSGVLDAKSLHFIKRETIDSSYVPGQSMGRPYLIDMYYDPTSYNEKGESVSEAVLAVDGCVYARKMVVDELVISPGGRIVLKKGTNTLDGARLYLQGDSSYDKNASVIMESGTDVSIWNGGKVEILSYDRVNGHDTVAIHASDIYVPNILPSTWSDALRQQGVVIYNRDSNGTDQAIARFRHIPVSVTFNGVTYNNSYSLVLQEQLLELGNAVNLPPNTNPTVLNVETLLSSSDIAENVTCQDGKHISKGSIVSANREGEALAVLSNKPYDSGVLGVVSTEPAIVLAQGQPGLPIALSGRVPCRVNGQGGDILPGDLITTSFIPGVGMKLNQSGAYVGKALESVRFGEDSLEEKKVLLWVTLGFKG